jgi:hypothetical protein
MVDADDPSKSQTRAAAVLSFLSRGFSEALAGRGRRQRGAGFVAVVLPKLLLHTVWFSAGAFRVWG